MEQSPQDTNPQESQSNGLTRRDALKALAVATGAAVLSFVPNKWSTPVVDVGMLPVHAQGLSGRGTIVVNAINGNVAAPVREAMPNSESMPNPFCDLTSDLAFVSIPVLALAHCFALNGGSITWTNIQAGDYGVFWNSNFCVFNMSMPQTAHVVPGGTATINLLFRNCAFVINAG